MTFLFHSLSFLCVVIKPWVWKSIAMEKRKKDIFFFFIFFHFPNLLLPIDELRKECFNLKGFQYIKGSSAQIYFFSMTARCFFFLFLLLPLSSHQVYITSPFHLHASRHYIAKGKYIYKRWFSSYHGSVLFSVIFSLHDLLSLHLLYWFRFIYFFFLLVHILISSSI